MQQETATGGVNVETNYRSGYHRTTRPKQYKDKKTGEYVEAETLPDVEAGAYLMEHRKGWTIYFDEVETWKAIPAEQFKELFLSFNQYAKDFIRKQFPPELWYLQSIYDAKCNSLDRDADKYLDTQALKIKGGRKSAEARAAKKESEPAQETETVEAPAQEDGDFPILSGVTLKETRVKTKLSVHNILRSYAEKHGLWTPREVVCSQIVQHKDVFDNYTVGEIADYLHNTFSPNRKNRQTNNDVLLGDLSLLRSRFETICGIMEDFKEMNGYYPVEIPDINTIPNDFWDEEEEPQEEPDWMRE